MSDVDKEVSFSNETLTIGMLQAVSGGATVAGFAQAQTIIDMVGYNALRIFLTLMVAALIAAVLAAYFKHRRHAGATRKAVVASVASIAIGLLALVAFLWIAEPPPAEDEDSPDTPVSRSLRA